MKISWGIGNS